MKEKSTLKSFNWTIFISIVILLLTSLQTANAQENCVCAICEKPCSQIAISGHRSGYSCYSGGSTSNSNGSSSVVNASSPLSMGIGIGAIGAVAGLLFDSKSGDDYSVAGGLGGFGLGVTIGLANSAKERSVAENLVYSVIAGASIGLAVAEAEKANSTNTDTKADNTLERAAEGALLGIAVDGLFTGFKKKTKGGYSYKSNKSNLFSKSYVTLTRNKIGLRVLL